MAVYFESCARTCPQEEMTYFNAGFWTRYFRGYFSDQVKVLHDTFARRLLPAFKDLEAEADEIATREYERLGALPGDENSDMATAAEDAQEAGLAHYEAMTAVRQTLLNLFPVALFHLYEQQFLLFFRRQVLPPELENDPRAFAAPAVRARMKELGLDWASFECWPGLHELELVTNTVKHADGRSADELKGIRPDLFVPPVLHEPRFLEASHRRLVLSPLAGEDIYVQEKDWQKYEDLVLACWQELAARIIKSEADGA